MALASPWCNSASPPGVVEVGYRCARLGPVGAGLWRGSVVVDPEHIMQVGMGFFASKTLLSAVELGVFTELASQTDCAMPRRRYSSSV